VVTDTGDEAAPRRDRLVTMQRIGVINARGSTKRITMPFFLTKYTLIGVFGDVPEPAAPTTAMSREQVRACNMHRLRAERWYNRAHMSKRTGIGPTFITEMERGYRAITIKTIDRIAAGLALAPSQVLAELDAPLTAR